MAAGSERLERETRRLKEEIRTLEDRLERGLSDALVRDRRYRRTLENIDDYAIFSIDADGVIESWNEGVERFLGYREGEFIGLHLRLIFTPEDREAGVPEREMRTAAARGRAQDDRWHVRKDGSRLFVNGTLASHGGGAGFVKIMQDRTEWLEREREREGLLAELQDLNATLDERVRRRTAELEAANASLRRSEATFAKAFHAAHVASGIMALDSGEILDVNEHACELLGVPCGELIGRTPDGAGLVDDLDPALLASLRERGSATHLEVTVNTRRGDPVVLLGSVDRIEFEGRDCALAMFLDITERKRTEREWMRAIETVMQDASWFSRSVLEQVTRLRSGLEPPQPSPDLTPRERQVLTLIASGFSNAAIAEELGLSTQTVRNYVSNTYRKVGVRSRADAVVWARDRGLMRL